MMKKILFVALSLTAVAAWAQANPTPAMPGVPPDAVGWVNLLIAGMTPVVIAGIKKLVPNVPSFALPFAAPVVGVLLTQVQAFASGHSANLIVGAVAGAVGLYLREVVDQSKQKLTNPPTT